MAITSKKAYMKAELGNLPRGEINPPEHFVQFYEDDTFLLDSLSRFIETGFAEDNACIVLATKAHRDELEARLQAKGWDLTAAREKDQYITLDATELLTELMVNGHPDPERFEARLGSLIERKAEGRNYVRVFGELVALLWAEGNRAAAIRLEELWNNLRRKGPSFSLFCAYPIRNFASEKYGEQFVEICSQHAHVIPDESFTELDSPEERLRAISLLQQKARSLEAEIAERKAAEERLRVSENRYRRLFEMSRDGILIVDPETYTITDANPAIIELLGSTEEQLLGQEFWQVGLFQDQATAVTALRELQKKSFQRYETLPLHSKDGQLRYIELDALLYQTNGHKVIQCNIRDVTDRKRAVEALRASEERFRTLANQAPLMIWQADGSGDNTYVNETWCNFTGFSPEESLGRGWLNAIHPDDRDAAFSLWMECIPVRAPYHTQFRVRRRDGVYRYGLVHGIACFDTEGNFTGYTGTVTDITEQKELEIQREAFVGIVTHELKTPLTALQGNVQLAQRRLTRLVSQAEQLPPEQMRALEEVLLMLSRSQQQLRVQHRLINDLLDVARIQEDKLELRLDVCDLVGLVYETVQDYQAANPARLITLELPEQEPLQVYGDRDRLRQVLSNYLANALKFSAESEPVHVGLAHEEGYARVWVQDHGPGLTHEQQQHIWKRFYQAPGTPAHKNAKIGLGLGLYICQQLISRQQGQVGIESQPGHGATFWFRLPLYTS